MSGANAHICPESCRNVFRNLLHLARNRNYLKIKSFLSRDEAEQSEENEGHIFNLRISIPSAPQALLKASKNRKFTDSILPSLP